MSISRGDIYVFCSSIKACMREISGLIESGKISEQDLPITIAELSCMKTVLERDDSGRNGA